MADQSVLTEYFSAAKSQHFQAAKRRKIVTSGRATFEKDVGKSVDGVLGQVPTDKASLAKPSPVITSNKKSERLSRKRSSRTKRSRRNIVVDKTLEVVSSKPTSVVDDHNTLEKRRKQPASTILSGQNSGTNSADVAKDINSVAKEANPEMTVESKAKTNDVNVQQRTGLKINPWISDQAKIVLFSRGKRALEKSLGLQGKMPGPKLMGKAQDKPVVAKLSPKPVVKQVNKVKDNIPRLHEGISGRTRKTASVGEESGSKLPAYQRYSHLLEAKQPKLDAVTRNLALPHNYKMLEEFFRCVDVVLSLKQKRYETCTFEKLKESVQEMCRKTFGKKHLAQMNTVYPEAFLFHQQNGLQGKKKSEYQLTVEFNVSEFKVESKTKQFKFVESSHLIARQKHFKRELLKITMSHHRDYLTKNHPKMSVDDNAIMRWHPCFRVDEVPEIKLSSLPEPPHVNTYSTAQDVLCRARQNMLPRVEKSLNNVANKVKENNTDIRKDQCKNEPQPKVQNASLKGVSQSLIEKIRQKEEKKLQETLTADPIKVQKQVMVQRLPELCRILKTYFVSEHKAAIPLEDANIKLSESCTSTLSPVQVEKHIKLLAELAPESVSIMHVRKCPYVKLKKNLNINTLVEKIKAKEIN